MFLISKSLSQRFDSQAKSAISNRIYIFVASANVSVTTAGKFFSSQNKNFNRCVGYNENDKIDCTYSEDCNPFYYCDK